MTARGTMARLATSRTTSASCRRAHMSREQGQVSQGHDTDAARVGGLQRRKWQVSMTADTRIIAFIGHRLCKQKQMRSLQHLQLNGLDGRVQLSAMSAGINCDRKLGAAHHAWLWHRHTERHASGQQCQRPMGRCQHSRDRVQGSR